MDYEKAYKEALERARICHKDLSNLDGVTACMTKDFFEEVFPELAESEDERIRKAIKSILAFSPTALFDKVSVSREDAITWLEKQSEKDSQVILPTFTFDDILALQCCMQAMSKNDELYKKLQSIHDRLHEVYRPKTQCEQKPTEEYEVPDTPIKDSEEVTSRMKYIDENLKPIAEFVMDYASWDLRKDEWNHPVATVPLFRVLDALVQKGKQYTEEYSVVDNNTEPKFEVGDVMRTLQEAADNITGGLPVVVHIGKKYYHCTNELIAIKNQDDYEYPPTNRRQKPDVSLEPKFKVGDWIVDDKGNIACIADTIKKKNGTVRYHLKFTDGGTSYPYTCFVDNDFHKFTIEDAKDGDVLATEYFIFIFKNVDNDNGVHYYCHYEIDKHEDDEQFGVALPQSLMGRVGNNITHYSPASREQYHLLFQKMKGAGYEWDAEKKELTKIM